MSTYIAADGKEFATLGELTVYEEEQRAQYAKDCADDFKFLVMCQAKGNYGMYELLRNNSLSRSPWRTKKEVSV